MYKGFCFFLKELSGEISDLFDIKTVKHGICKLERDLQCILARSIHVIPHTLINITFGVIKASQFVFSNPRLQAFLKELMEAARHSVSTLSQPGNSPTPSANASERGLT